VVRGRFQFETVKICGPDDCATPVSDNRVVPFQSLTLSVLIASPGDVLASRDAVEDVIKSWNRDHADSQRTVLLPMRWETDAVPEIGDNPQAILNRQLVDRADIVIALFHTRLGTPTESAKSGTVEEIERAHERGVPVHVYFSEMPLPANVDLDDVQRVRDLRADLGPRGLYMRFISNDELMAFVRTALERDVRHLVGSDPASSPEGDSRSTDAPKAIIRFRLVKDGRSTTLEVENLGTAPARKIVLASEPIGEGRAPELLLGEPIEILPPSSTFRVPVILTLGCSAQMLITAEWFQGEERLSEQQSVSVF
jgi:hypothetical protein